MRQSNREKFIDGITHGDKWWYDRKIKIINTYLENPEKYGKYSVDDSSGTHLAVIGSKGETVEYYIFGRSKSDYSRSYVRVGDDPKVYLADQNVNYMLSTRPTYWGEKPKVDIPVDTLKTK